jgi:hypothetical protein
VLARGIAEREEAVLDGFERALLRCDVAQGGGDGGLRFAGLDQGALERLQRRLKPLGCHLRSPQQTPFGSAELGQGAVIAGELRQCLIEAADQLVLVEQAGALVRQTLFLAALDPQLLELDEPVAEIVLVAPRLLDGRSPLRDRPVEPAPGVEGGAGRSQEVVVTGESVEGGLVALRVGQAALVHLAVHLDQEVAEAAQAWPR